MRHTCECVFINKVCLYLCMYLVACEEPAV